MHKGCKIAELYSQSPDDFAKLKENAAIMLTVFDSNYICEQTFSQIKIAKSKIRLRLTDKHLHDILRMSVTNFNVDVDVLLQKYSTTRVSSKFLLVLLSLFCFLMKLTYISIRSTKI